MFNNKFNSSKCDPLVEAVKQAQQDGDHRRIAEAHVNEQFGVYSRKAVVREHLAAYDAALVEAYKSLKEGKPNDGNLANNYPPYDKVTRGDVIAGRLGKDQMGGKKKMEEKKDCYEESDGLPPSDAAKQAGARQQTQTPSSTPARTGNAAGATIAKAKDALNELTKPTGKTAMMAFRRAERSDDETNDYTRTNRLFNWKQKHLPGKSARNQKDTGKAELPDYSEKDSGYVPTVKKSGKLMKSTEKATKAEIKSRLGKHTKPKHLPEESIYEAIARKRDIAKGGVTAPIEYADKMGFANPGAISKLNESWKKLKEAKKEMEEARKCMGEEFDSFDFSVLDEAYVNYIAEAINKYGLQEEHPVVTSENIHMFNEAYIAAVLDEAAACEYEKMEKHEKKAKEHKKKMKELDEARMRAEKECNEEELDEAKKWIQSAIKRPGSLSKKLGVPEEKNIPASKLAIKKGDTAATKKQKVLAKTLKHLARKKKMEEEVSLGMKSAGEAIGVRSPDRFSNIPRTTIRAPGSPEAKAAATQLKADKKAPSVGDDRYTIKKGDTLSGIAKRTGTSVSSLAAANKIADPNKISAGAKLSVNAAKTPLGDVPSTTKNPAGPPMPASPKPPAAPKALGGTKWSDQGAKERAASSSMQASTMKSAGDTPTVQTGTTAPKSTPAPTPPSRPADLGAPKVDVPTPPSRPPMASDLPKIDTGPSANPQGPGTSGADGADGASIAGGKGGKGGKGGSSLNESVQVGDRTYRIV